MTVDHELVRMIELQNAAAAERQLTGAAKRPGAPKQRLTLEQILQKLQTDVDNVHHSVAETCQLHNESAQKLRERFDLLQQPLTFDPMKDEFLTAEGMRFDRADTRVVLMRDVATACTVQEDIWIDSAAGFADS